MVGAPGAVVETQQFDARVRWLGEVRYAARVRVAVGADEVMGRALPNAQDPGYVQFRLERPAAIARGQPVLVRRYSPPEVLGGGEVVVPSAPRRRRSDPPPTWASDPQGASGDEVIRRIRAAPGGVPLSDLASSLGVGAGVLAPELARHKASGELLEFGGLWFVPERFAECRDRFIHALRDLHEAEPTRSFQPRERVVRNAGLRWEGKPLDRICAFLAGEGAIRLRGNAIALPDFQVRLKPRQRELLDRVVAKMTAAGLGALDAGDLAQGLGVPPQAVREIWELGVECGELVRMPDGIVLTRSQIQRALDEIRSLAQAGPFTAAQVRDRLQSSRSRVIPLLEYLDAVGVTQRVGDRRVLREVQTAPNEAGASSKRPPDESPESSSSA
jgi:selenocysteine-specific elongation factor